eukprot:COSAG01_NODE_3921_length_5535_cov_44.878933_3_plen_158_part_00
MIQSRWVSKLLAFAGKLQPRRLNNQPFLDARWQDTGMTGGVDQREVGSAQLLPGGVPADPAQAADEAGDSVAVGVQTSSIRWQAATTATQSLAVLITPLRRFTPLRRVRTPQEQGQLQREAARLRGEFCFVFCVHFRSYVLTDSSVSPFGRKMRRSF